MTFLVKDIADQLLASTAIVNAFSNRVFPEVIPQGSNQYPAIVLNDISNAPEYYLGGESGMHTSTVQVDVWTDGTGGKQKANELGELVRNRLSGYRGQFGTGVYGTARMISNNSNAAAPVDASDNHRRRVSMDFEFIHSAAVPDFT